MQGMTVESQVGFDDAFQTILAEGGISAYKAVPWLPFAREKNWSGFFSEAKAHVNEFKPDIIYFQFFHHHNCPDVTAFFDELRRTGSRPVIAVSAGDAFSWAEWFGRRYPVGFLSAARAADVTFVTAMGKCADFLVQKGIKNIVLLPLGSCQFRFKPKAIEAARYKPDFDVVFIGGGGSWYRVPPYNFLFYYGLKRDALVRLLQKRYGKKFGLYGKGWKGKPSWQGPVPFAQQLDVCRNSQVVFGGCPGIYQDYYASDRPFIQGVSGIPLVDWYVPRVDKLLRNQEHCYLVNDGESMLSQIDRLLETGVEDRLRRGAAAAEYIHKTFSHAALMRFFVKTVSAVHAARQQGRTASAPDFDFLLPEVKIENERHYAQRNWAG